jgi:hypothetical protein
MFFDESVNNLFVLLYDIEKQHPFRHAGIWGRNVNQLGYYASLLLILNLILYHYKIISLHIIIVFSSFAFAAIVISGMRLGLYVLTFLLILFSLFYKKPIVSFTSLVKCSLLLLLLGYCYSLIFDNVAIIEYFLKRFDVNLFVDDLTGESGAHVGKMYVKWYEIFTAKDDFGDFLFSMYPSWKNPDSLVIFYFANSGLFGFTFFVLFIIYLTVLLFYKKFPYIPFFIMSFLLIVSFKGNFLFNNMGMFLFTYIFYIFLQKSFKIESYKAA